LGNAGVTDWRIISKLSAISDNCADVHSLIHDAISDSLNRLGIRQLYGVLLHRPDQLMGEQGKEIYAALMALKATGSIQKIGISIYEPNELDILLTQYPFDIVQAPFSIMDQRLVQSGWLHRLHEAGIEVHARSIFLQGLLLMKKRPSYFEKWATTWKLWDEWLRDQDLTPTQACVRFAMSFNEITKVIVGIDSVSQLQEILNCGQSHLTNLPKWPHSLDVNLINPSYWKLQ
jgi:aryl-alcohol dehydrogenase-like predicted oxidoreductase